MSSSKGPVSQTTDLSPKKEEPDSEQQQDGGTPIKSVESVTAENGEHPEDPQDDGEKSTKGHDENGVSDKVEKAVDDIAEAAENGAAEAEEVGNKIAKAAENGAAEAGKVADEIADAVGNGASEAENVADNIAEAAENGVEKAETAVDHMTEAVGTGASKAEEAVEDTVEAVKDGASDAEKEVEETVEAVKTGISDAAAKIESFIKGDEPEENDPAPDQASEEASEPEPEGKSLFAAMSDFTGKAAAHIGEQIQNIASGGNDEDKSENADESKNGDGAEEEPVVEASKIEEANTGVESESPKEPEEKSLFSTMSDLTMKAASQIGEKLSDMAAGDEEEEKKSETSGDAQPGEPVIRPESVSEADAPAAVQEDSPTDPDAKSLLATMNDLTMKAAANIEEQLTSIVTGNADAENGNAEDEAKSSLAGDDEEEAVEDEQEKEGDEGKVEGTGEETEPLIEEEREEEVSATPPSGSPSKEPISTEEDFTSVAAEDGSETKDDDVDDQAVVQEEEIVVTIASGLTAATPPGDDNQEEPVIKAESVEGLDAAAPADSPSEPESKSLLATMSDLTSQAAANIHDQITSIVSSKDDAGDTAEEEMVTATSVSEVSAAPHSDDEFVEAQEDPGDVGKSPAETPEPDAGSPTKNSEASEQAEGAGSDQEKAEHMDEVVLLAQAAGLISSEAPDGDASSPTKDEGAQPMDETEDDAGVGEGGEAMHEEQVISVTTVTTVAATPPGDDEVVEDSKESDAQEGSDAGKDEVDSQKGEAKSEDGDTAKHLDEVVILAQEAGLVSASPGEDADTGASDVKSAPESPSDHTQIETTPVKDSPSADNELKIDEVVFEMCPSKNEVGVDDDETENKDAEESKSESDAAETVEKVEEVISAVSVSQAAATPPGEHAEEPVIVPETATEENAEVGGQASPEEKSLFSSMVGFTKQAAAHIGEQISSLATKNDDEDDEGEKDEEKEPVAAEKEVVPDLSEEAAARIEEQIEAFTTNSGVYASPPDETQAGDDTTEVGAASPEAAEGEEEAKAEADDAEQLEAEPAEAGTPDDGSVKEQAESETGEEGATDEVSAPVEEEEVIAVTKVSDVAASPSPVEEEIMIATNVTSDAAAPPSHNPSERDAASPQTPMESQIESVFKLFDSEAEGKVELREIGSLLRCLKLNPTEAEIDEMKSEFAEDNGKLTLEAFLPKALEVLLEGKFAPATEEELMDAFAVLDKNNAGFLTAGQMEVYMKSKGEPLSDDEFQDMISVAADEDGNINYKKFIQELIVVS